MSRSDKKGLWKILPEVKSPEWGKLGPAFGYGLGCGVGFGVGIVGGVGLGVGLPGLQFGFGFGGGCGVGIGFGYGLGKGRAYDSKNSYSNVGVSASQRRGRKALSNTLSDSEVGRLVGDVMQEVAEAVARIGQR